MGKEEGAGGGVVESVVPSAGRKDLGEGRSEIEEVAEVAERIRRQVGGGGTSKF